MQSFSCDTLFKKVKEKIIIRDILVTQDSTRLVAGDFNRRYHASESNAALVARMLEHIRQVAEYGRQIHWQDNFSSDKTTMKSDRQNNITRLSFNEFYFYPYHSRACPQTGKALGPLDKEAFYSLTQAVIRLAANLPENLHLTLASFPVKDAENCQYNKVFYVQCGKRPVLNILTKLSYGEGDPEYPGLQRYSIFKGDESESAASQVLTAALGTKSGESPFPNAPILCTTAGGASFWTVIDICFDHFHGVAKHAFEHQIRLMQAAQKRAIPEYISYVLTSNYIVELVEKNALTATVVHADGVSPKLYTVGNGTKWAAHKETKEEVLGQRQYSTLCYPSREMDLAPPKLLSSIQQYNKLLPYMMATQKSLFSSCFLLFSQLKEGQSLPKGVEWENKQQSSAAPASQEMTRK